MNPDNYEIDDISGDHDGVWTFDSRGFVQHIPVDVQKMFYPVRHLGCGQIHDAGKCEITVRWADCTQWKCPNQNRVIYKMDRLQAGKIRDWTLNILWMGGILDTELLKDYVEAESTLRFPGWLGRINLALSSSVSSGVDLRAGEDVYDYA